MNTKTMTSIAVIATFVVTLIGCSTQIENKAKTQDELISEFKELSVNKLDELNDLKFKYGHLKTNSLETKLLEEATNDIKNTLKPLHDKSKELLISFEFNQELLSEYDMSLDDPEIIYLSFALIEYHNQNGTMAKLNRVLDLFIPRLYASKLWQCAKSALGVEIAIELFRNESLSSIAGRRLLIKTFTKIGARYLGWFGVAYTTTDFIDCMWLE